jgi:hypothetical protein
MPGFSGHFPSPAEPGQEDDETVYPAGEAVVDLPSAARSGFVLGL